MFSLVLPSLESAYEVLKYLPKESPCDPNVQQETGYIQIGDKSKHYFFWFFHSRNDPSTDKLVIWLNGGPGCSSMLGLFTENGPCSVNEFGNGTKVNKYSWNSNANVLYVDQPAGTGFSYGTDFDTNEESVGNDFYVFLDTFFEAHPELRKREMYIAGESYGGHYVPAIAYRIYEENKKATAAHVMNLRGIAIGNGLVSAEKQYPLYPDMITSSNSHKAPYEKDGVVYKLMKAAIFPCVKLIQACDSNNILSEPSCIAAEDVCNGAFMLPYQQTGLNVYDMRLKCEKPPLCNDYTNLEIFLHNPDILKEIGVDPEKVTWEECNNVVNLGFTLAGDGIKSMEKYVAQLLEEIDVVVYAGDQDYICNWLGNLNWVNELEWSGKEDFKSTELEKWGDAGEIKSAGKLTFVRVYEAGHMVPQDQPEAALNLLESLVLKLKSGHRERTFSDFFRVIEE
eukprot:augustus_masked-scaffold_7-processed-gene-7.41-mRNA-1 protein AED:0.01 eAED:0.01 QI:0/-1/0/1/-1/1/1/0/452